MERRSTRFLPVVALLVAITIAASNAAAQNPGGNPDAAKMKNPVAATAASVTAGAAIYKKNCSFCHGAEAKGDGKLIPKGMTMPADLTDAKWDRGSTDGEIFTVIMKGAGPKFEMKGVEGKMAERDVWNVVNFLRSLGPKNPAR